MTNLIGSDQHIKSFEVITAQVILFIEQTLTIHYILKRFTHPENHFTFYPGIIMAGTEKIVFIETVNQFLVGSNIVFYIDIGRMCIERSGIEMISGKENSIGFIQQSHGTWRMHRCINHLQHAISQIQHVAIVYQGCGLNSRNCPVGNIKIFR